MDTSKKENIVKVMTVPIPKQEAPEEGEVKNTIAALVALQASAGWAILVKILNDNIAYLEQAILDKIDPRTREALTDKEIEVLRIKRSLNIEVRDTPANYSRVVRDVEGEPEEYDPYPKTIEEVNEMDKRGRESAGDDPGK